jgi:ABC-type lipoprotein release transport system permease subunit
MFLIEAALLGVLGVILGNIIGALGVAWLANYGIPMGDMGAVADGVALGSTLHARFNPSGMISLSLWTLFITILAALYPAWYASRQEPVDALRAL